MTRDDIIRMALKAGGRQVGMYFDMDVFMLERFVALVAAAEREACAKLCDSSMHDTYIDGYTGAKHSARRECAAAIRARGDSNAP